MDTGNLSDTAILEYKALCDRFGAAYLAALKAADSGRAQAMADALSAMRKKLEFERKKGMIPEGVFRQD